MDDTSSICRGELLAVADADELKALADRWLLKCPPPGPTIISPPTTGLVALDVVEPIAHDRFFLGEAVVSTAEVRIGAAYGWSMRLGDDHAAVLAAAICDAAAEVDAKFAKAVAALCERTRQRRQVEATAEHNCLVPTAVTFEELS